MDTAVASGGTTTRAEKRQRHDDPADASAAAPVAPAASQPNTEEGAERALQLFQTGVESLGDYADPGIKKRRAGFYYVTEGYRDSDREVRKAAGTRMNYGKLSTAKQGRKFTERPAAMAKLSQKVLNARKARGGPGNVAHEMPAAQAKRKADTVARLPYVHGLSAYLICRPSCRCANCKVSEADGGLLATGCTHSARAAGQSGIAKLSIDDWSKLNNSTDLITSAEMANKCVGCYARDSRQEHLVRNFNERVEVESARQRKVAQTHRNTHHDTHKTRANT
jgi:hypothetical protein